MQDHTEPATRPAAGPSGRHGIRSRVDLLAAHLLPFARERAAWTDAYVTAMSRSIRRPRWSGSSERQPLPGARTAGRTRPSSPTWSTRSARSTTTDVRAPVPAQPPSLDESSAVAAGGSSAVVARSASVATSSARARSEALRFQRRFSGETVSAMNTSPDRNAGSQRPSPEPARAPLRELGGEGVGTVGAAPCGRVPAAASVGDEQVDADDRMIAFQLLEQPGLQPVEVERRRGAAAHRPGRARIRAAPPLSLGTPPSRESRRSSAGDAEAGVELLQLPAVRATHRPLADDEKGARRPRDRLAPRRRHSRSAWACETSIADAAQVDFQAPRAHHPVLRLDLDFQAERTGRADKQPLDQELAAAAAPTVQRPIAALVAAAPRLAPAASSARVRSGNSMSSDARPPAAIQGGVVTLEGNPGGTPACMRKRTNAGSAARPAVGLTRGSPEPGSRSNPWR